MNTGQTLFVIFGILILTTFMLTVYRGALLRLTTNINNEAVMTATSLGQSLLDEIQTKAFDEKVLTKTTNVPDSLTASASLGPDAGELTNIQFDDVDDYHNYTRSDSLERLGRFNLRAQVYYVVRLTPETKTLSRTFSKRVDVFITNAYLPDTLKLNHVFCF